MPGPDQQPDSLFLTGWIALQRQHGRRRARGRNSTRSRPFRIRSSLQARAWYWVARATGGDAARDSYRRAAAFPTTYYGQLAIGALDGKSGVAPAILQAADPAIPGRPGNRASMPPKWCTPPPRWCGWNDEKWARQFLQTEAQHATARRPISRSPPARRFLLGMPEIAVQTARYAGRQWCCLAACRLSRAVHPRRAGTDPPLILGLMRQESSFDAGITSGAGAVGLMQLMPATARQIAGQNQTSLDLKNPGENMRIGIAYFQNLLQQFNFVQAYAIAAYNAGPHRAHAWVTANGDAAASGNPADMIDWIEQIPYAETRNYVQRVLENTHIYAARAAQ